jgi:hypothetical protein
MRLWNQPRSRRAWILGHRVDVLAQWRKFWPQRGTPPNWDGIAQVEDGAILDDWLLLEAKANHPEFCGAPCGASPRGGRAQIEHALGEVKKYLGIHRHVSWLGSYYQHANRLACLYFLNVKAGIPARLIDVYFIGDAFPDGRSCPKDEGEWRELLHARDLTLGLPSSHPLSDRVHEVFLKAVPTTARAGAVVGATDSASSMNGLDDASLPFLRRLQADKLLSESDWVTIAGWVEDARTFLRGPDHTVELDADGEPIINIDADPRNADWTKIVRVHRLTGCRLPDWASLWLWWLARERGPKFWAHVARAARSAGIEKLPTEANRRRPAHE